LEEAILANMQISMVFSLDEKYSAGVSGYYPIHKTANENAIEFVKFRKINDEKTIKRLKAISPDYIFVVGLSQLVGRDVLKCALKGVIGLHPTALPNFRGRAPMVWQILLGVRESKITMFLMNQGVDAGDIIGQEPYIINDTDYAEDLDRKGLIALRSLAKRVLNQIKTDTIKPVRQNEAEATYLLMRTPEDGQIDWSLPCEKIQCLVRAVSRPFPGAFSYYEGVKVVFWRADYLENTKYIGMPGQIAEISNDKIDVLCNDGMLRVYEYEIGGGIKLKPGHKFRQLNK
jgi:methionyl-tRNA formyltransferase